MKFHNSETSEDPLPTSSRLSSSSQPLVSLSQVELTNGNNNAGFGETLGNVASIPCGTDIVDGVTIQVMKSVIVRNLSW